MSADATFAGSRRHRVIMTSPIQYWERGNLSFGFPKLTDAIPESAARFPSVVAHDRSTLRIPESRDTNTILPRPRYGRDIPRTYHPGPESKSGVFDRRAPLRAVAGPLRRQLVNAQPRNEQSVVKPTRR